MVYARKLTLQEGQKLRNIIRRSGDATQLRRAQIIFASAQGTDVSEIARTYFCSEEHVRIIIKKFNEDGLASIPRKKGGGRDSNLTDEEKSMIVELSLMPPGVVGYPFTTWSLRKLAQAAVERDIVAEISPETVRQILKEAKVSYQRTKTWKESDDPEFESKKNE